MLDELDYISHLARWDVLSTPELVWGWSAESESPYYPFYRLETAAVERYVDEFGAVPDTLQLEAPAR